jgi:hypothetical protein
MNQTAHTGGFLNFKEKIMKNIEEGLSQTADDDTYNLADTHRKTLLYDRAAQELVAISLYGERRLSMSEVNAQSVFADLAATDQPVPVLEDQITIY